MFKLFWAEKEIDTSDKEKAYVNQVGKTFDNEEAAIAYAAENGIIGHIIHDMSKHDRYTVFYATIENYNGAPTAKLREGVSNDDLALTQKSRGMIRRQNLDAIGWDNRDDRPMPG